MYAKIINKYLENSFNFLQLSFQFQFLLFMFYSLFNKFPSGARWQNVKICPIFQFILSHSSCLHIASSFTFGTHCKRTIVLGLIWVCDWVGGTQISLPIKAFSSSATNNLGESINIGVNSFPPSALGLLFGFFSNFRYLVCADRATGIPSLRTLIFFKDQLPPTLTLIFFFFCQFQFQHTGHATNSQGI